MEKPLSSSSVRSQSNNVSPLELISAGHVTMYYTSLTLFNLIADSYQNMAPGQSLKFNGML